MTQNIYARLKLFSSRRWDWDRNCNLPPDRHAIRNALAWLDSLPEKQKRLFDGALVSPVSDGEICFELWTGDKKLIVYVSRRGKTYLGYDHAKDGESYPWIDCIAGLPGYRLRQLLRWLEEA